MILVDTSVWIDHFRRSDSRLERLLEASRIAVHPFIIGEIAIGSLKNRNLVLSDLAALPSLDVAADDEVLIFIEKTSLAGSGVGYLDAHLLASVKLTPGAGLWTHDRKLAMAAAALELTADLAD